MRAIERTSRFKRDYRREESGVLSKKLDQLLIEAVELLAADKPLPQRYFDHPLSGCQWRLNFRQIGRGKNRHFVACLSGKCGLCF